MQPASNLAFAHVTHPHSLLSEHAVPTVHLTSFGRSHPVRPNFPRPHSRTPSHFTSQLNHLTSPTPTGPHSSRTFPFLAQPHPRAGCRLCRAFRPCAKLVYINAHNTYVPSIVGGVTSITCPISWGGYRRKWNYLLCCLLISDLKSYNIYANFFSKRFDLVHSTWTYVFLLLSTSVLNDASMSHLFLYLVYTIFISTLYCPLSPQLIHSHPLRRF